MGSFNIAGTMSNLSISPGDKVVFIPLILTHPEYANAAIVKGSTSLVSNSGASMFFCPRFLPIIGKYADYGSIDDIDYDENVQYIEEYFGISIYEFMQQITRNQWGDKKAKCIDDEKTEELYGLSGMFELYSVYQDMVKFNKLQNKALDGLDLDIRVLELMGFKRQKRSTGDPRYSKYYAHSGIEDYAVFSDGEFSEFVEIETGIRTSLYSPQQIMDFFPNVQFDGVEKLKDCCVYAIQVKAAIEAAIEIQRLETEHGEDAWIYAKKKPEHCCWHLREWKKMAYAVERDALWLEEAFVDLLNFDSAMYSTNNYYYPAANGEQFGNHFASKALCESSLRFIEQKIAEEQEDDTL